MAKGIIKIRADRCKGCEICISVCPKKILKIDEEHLNARGYHPVCVTDDTQCIGCANCAIMCPDGIINVYTE